MDNANFLRSHIEKVISISDVEFQTILSFFEPICISKKQYLLQAGKRVTSEFLVVKGCFKTAAYDSAGRECIIQFALEHWWVSDYAALPDKAVGKMFVQALEDSLVLELSLENKLKMCKLVPKMYQFHGAKSLAGYVAGQKRILSLLSNSAKEQYELLLSLYPELFQRLSKKTIANYLGVCRETLSRFEKKSANLKVNKL